MMDQLKPCQFRQVDNHGRILCNVIKGGDREVSVKLCAVCPVSQINCQNLRAGLEKRVSTPITVRFATGRVEVWDDSPPSIEFKQAACAAKTMPIHSPRDCAGCPIRVPNVVPTSAIQVAHRSKQNTPVSVPVAAAAPAAIPQRTPRNAPRPTPPVAQPIAQAAQVPLAQAPQQPAALDVGAAADLVARAKATAARKAEEKRQRELEREAERVALAQQEQAQASAADAKPKIIQLKEWLAGQRTKKASNGSTNSIYKPQPVRADEDGVSDIIYAPLGMQAAGAYQETIDYERCVGWTD